MPNLTEAATFDSAVYRIDQSDPVLGWDGTNLNISNLQAQALANRTQWLKSRVDLGSRITAHSALTPVGAGTTFTLLPTDMVGKMVRIDVASFKCSLALPLASGVTDGGNIEIAVIAGANHQFISSNDKTVRLFPAAGDHILDLRTGVYVDEIYINPYTTCHVHKLASNEWVFYTINSVEDSPAGMVSAWAVNSPPYGWLECNGAAISRTVYAALFANIGLTFGNPGPTQFNLPDLRGEFIRGWDHGRGIDTGRAFGGAQLDQFQGHYHDLAYQSTGSTPGSLGTVLNTSPSSNILANQARGIVTDGSNGTPRVGAETRPRNISMMFCIKY